MVEMRGKTDRRRTVLSGQLMRLLHAQLPIRNPDAPVPPPAYLRRDLGLPPEDAFILWWRFW